MEPQSAKSPPKLEQGEVRRSDAVMIMRLMEHHSARAIPIPEELARAAAYTAAKLIQSSSERTKARAVELVHKMLQHNLRVYAEADKLARLDSGAPTERVEHTGDGQVDLREASRRDPAILAALIRLEERREREEDEAESRGNGGA